MEPITESLLILEYIDEVWKRIPRLLPEDSYNKAQVRFWANFFDQQVFRTIASIVMTDGEAQEKAIEGHREKIKVFEEGMKKLMFRNINPFDEKNVGLLEILLVTTFGSYKAQEEVLGFKVIDPETNPIIFSWLNCLIEVPVIKDSMPAHELQVQLIRSLRNTALN